MKKIYYYHKVLTLIILCCTLLMSTITYGQYYKRGFVPIQWPQGGFSIDGDAYQNTNIYINCAPDSLNNFGDWFYYASYPYPTYPGGSIFNQAGDTIPASPIWARIANYIDNFNTNDQSVFGQSNKINDNPNTYNVKPGNVPPKDDMERATAAFSYGDPSLTGHSVGPNPTSFVGDPNDLWCVFAADRWKTNGNSYMDFEFNQKAIIWNQGDGSFTTLADPFYNGVPTGGRTPGDLLVTIQFEQGGTRATLYVDRWELKPDGTGYIWTDKNVDTQLPANSVFGTHNLCLTTAPWKVYDQQPPNDYTYAVNQFAEGAVNLTKVMGTNGICGSLATVWCRTKSSASGTAELKDLAGPPFTVGVTPVPPVAHCPDPVDLPACTPLEDIQNAWNDWKLGFSYSGGTEPVTPSFIPSTFPDLPENVICGWEYSVEYKVVDFCEKRDSCTSTFTVEPAPAVVFNCAVDKTEASCQTQAAIDASFATWLTTTTASGGCNGVLTRNPVTPVAPSACGGFVDVTWTYTTSCATPSSCTKRFTVTAAPILHASCPAPVTILTFETQDSINTAFATWLDGFGFTGGCNPTPPPLNYLPPDHCGGRVDITYIVTDACAQSDQCSSYFSVTVNTDVTLICPPTQNEAACQTQAAIDEAFFLWVNDIGWSSNCNGHISTVPVTPVAPDHCGGTITVTWTVTQDCDPLESSCSATFTVATPDPIVIHCPDPVALGDCTPSADITAAYTAWKLGFTKSGDCILYDNMASFPDLFILPDGSVNLSFTYIVWGLCDVTEHTCSSTFTAGPCGPNCGTVYAKLENDTPVGPYARCFEDDGFSRWGWTNYIPIEGTYSMNIYSGADHCKYSPEKLVGTATVTYEGGELTVEYFMDAGFSVNEVHVNVACDKYPKKNGKYTVAPGQYIFGAGGFGYVSDLTVTFTDVEGAVWVIIHGVGCDIGGEGSPTFEYDDPIHCSPPAAPGKESPVITPQPKADNSIDVNIHPNPFIGATDIEFTIPWSGEATVEIYNTLGDRITTLFNATVEANQKYSVRFTAPDQSGQGMFLCVIRSESGYVVKHMIMNR